MNTRPMGLAVITGASSGLGAIYADRLARRGYDLLLVARNRERMDALAKKLAANKGRKIEILGADLMDFEDVAELERILRDDSRVTLLVNNAGLGATAPLLNSDVAEAVTRLTYAVVPAFVKRGTGTIINIGSIVAVAPERLNGVYGGTKAFVLAFSYSLRYELANTGVKVQVVLPGATATDFWSKSGACRTPTAGNCHASGEHGRRRTFWPGSRRVRDDTRAPRRPTMAGLRSRTSGAAPQLVSR